MNNFRNVLQKIWSYRFPALLIYFFVMAGFFGEDNFYE